jgi:hypothetical protein
VVVLPFRPVAAGEDRLRHVATGVVGELKK